MLWHSKLYDELKKVEASAKAGFSKVREEMDDHLEGINQNTDEIQGVYDFLAELESKIDKLSERMDYVDMLVNPAKSEPLACNMRLNKREQEVFMVLYTADEQVTTTEMARKLGFNEEMVINYLYNLISKGVPILKECIGETMLLSLNPRFKDLQAKKNILNIEEGVAKEILHA